VPEVRAQVAQVSDYQDALDAAWARHLAPRREGAPTVVSTFAGCGGSSLGYSMAGFRELAASEWDADARASFGLNFPGVPVLGGDVRELSAGELMEAAGVGPGELDVLDGSPPCQGFSTAGKRELGDMRNQLYNEFMRLLEGVRPRAFVMENVWGMVKGKMKLVFADCMRKLKVAGYDVRCARLNAMWFGVPQSRERLFFLGVRDDLGARPEYPGPTVARPITVLEAIGDLIGKDFSLLHETGGQFSQGILSSDGVSPSLTVSAGRGGHLRIAVSSGAAPLSPKAADGPDLAQGTRPGHVWIRNDMHRNKDHGGDEPSPSLCAAVPPVIGKRRSEKRALTVEEGMRLQSLPARFRLEGSYAERWKQLGNGVPPLMMEAVALRVAATLAEADGHADQAGACGEAR